MKWNAGLMVLGFWALTISAQSQTFEGNVLTLEHEASVWARTGVQMWFDALPLSLMVDTQLRAGGKKAEFQTLQGRVHLNYHLSPQTFFSVGGIGFTPQRGVVTHIALVQAMHFFATEELQPALRTRLDYRWQTDYNGAEPRMQASWRLRLQPTLFVPLAQAFKLMLNTELFFEEQTPWLIDENRFQTGVQWKLASSSSLLVAYQNRTFFGEKAKSEHTLFLVLLFGMHL